MEKCLLCLFPVRSQFLDFIKWMHGFRCIFFWVTVKSNYNQTICATIVFCFPVSCRLEYIRFHRVQTKGKRFSHHEQWCEFWVHTFMYISKICPVEHLFREVLTSSYAFISIVTSCCGFWITFIGRWIFLARMSRTVMDAWCVLTRRRL